MRRHLALLPVLALVAMVVRPAGAADPQASALAVRQQLDGAVAVVSVGTRSAPAYALAAVVRLTDTGGRASTTGTRPYVRDQHVICLAYVTRTFSDHGCVIRPPAPVTTGLVVPERATVSVRVPSARDRGHWLEARLAIAGHGRPGAYPWAFRSTSPGPGGAGLFAAGGALTYRDAVATGTVRTSRTVRQRAGRTVLGGVVRGDVAGASAGAYRNGALQTQLERDVLATVDRLRLP